MAARSVQISLDDELLKEVDSRPETQREGRSAVIKRALRLYLERKRAESIDERYASGYGAGKSKSEPANEFDALLDSQAWSDKR